MTERKFGNKCLLECLESNPKESLLKIINKISLTESENISIIRYDNKNIIYYMKNGDKFIDALDRKLNVD